MSIQAMIFDLDDTLYTDWKSCEQAGLQNIMQYGQTVLQISGKMLRSAFLEARKRLEAHLGPIGSAHNRVLFAQWALESLGVNPILHSEQLHNAYWRGVFDTMQIEPGLISLFQNLKERGVRIGICTNMMADIQMRKLIHLGIADYIDCFVTSEEAGVDKPDARILQCALHKMGVTPEQALFVGDTYGHDILVAHKVGVPSIWINRFQKEIPAESPLPFATVQNMEEASQVIQTQFLS